MGEQDKVDKMTKRVGNMLRLYQFKQRLMYKCNCLGAEYKEVDEAYTTKCCSRCGYFNSHVKKEKLFVCKGCKTERIRDINAAENMIIVSMEEQ